MKKFSNIKNNLYLDRYFAAILDQVARLLHHLNFA